MTTKAIAPFKRGQKLAYTFPHNKTTINVKYVKWMGFERSSLIVVETVDGSKQRITVHVDDVKVRE